MCVLLLLLQVSADGEVKLYEACVAAGITLLSIAHRWGRRRNSRVQLLTVLGMLRVLALLCCCRSRCASCCAVLPSCCAAVMLCCCHAVLPFPAAVRAVP
jgi:hypothetical protein